MKTWSNQVISSLSWDLMVLTQLSCTDLVLMLVTQLWHSDSMVSFTLLKVKMDGTGQDTVYKEISFHNGKNGPRMPTSTLLTCHLTLKQELDSTKLLLKNSSSKPKVFHTVITTSSLVGLIPPQTTSHLLFHQVSSQLFSLFLNTLPQALLIFSITKLLTRDLTPQA